MASPEVPAFSAPREIETVHEGGGWHFKDGVRRDNIGDFTMGAVSYGDRLWYVLMARMGTAPPAGSMWYAPYGDPYSGWTQGMPPGGRPEPPVKSLVMPTGAANIDTHAWVRNPLTKVITWIHSVKDLESGIYHLERATSNTLDPRPEAFTRYSEDLVAAPAEECSVVIDPWTAEGALFYVVKTTEKPDPYGVRFRSRLFRRSWALKDFDTRPQLGDEEMVFSPDQDGQGPWGTAFTILQPHVCILPDGSYLLTALGKTPIAIRNTLPPQPAVGQMNKTVAVGLWRSTDQGRTWVPLPGNPVFSREFLSLPDAYANCANSPHCWYDPWARKLYFACQRNTNGEVNQPGSRLILCETTL